MAKKRGSYGKSKQSTTKVYRVVVRLTKREYHRLKFLGQTYAGGNLAKWCRYALLEANRTYLVPTEEQEPEK